MRNVLAPNAFVSDGETVTGAALQCSDEDFTEKQNTPPKATSTIVDGCFYGWRAYVAIMFNDNQMTLAVESVKFLECPNICIFMPG
jgi:hypothetical protein